MSFYVMIGLWIVGTIAMLYYAQMWGLRRSIGPWGGILLVVLLGPVGLLVILLFPKVERIPPPTRKLPAPIVERTQPRPTPRPKVSN